MKPRPVACRAALAALMISLGPPSLAARCTVLAGGGRQPSGDAQANEAWNRLNFSFFDATLTAMASTGKVVPTFFTLGSGDAANAAQAALAQARKEGCEMLVFVSVHGDITSDGGQLVFAFRAAQIRRGTDAQLSVGPSQYEREYRYATTAEGAPKIVPSRIAEQAVRDYLARGR